MAAAGALVLAGQVAPPAAADACAQSSMYVAAHEDDTLLFMSPALLTDIQAGSCVQTVFVTAGDANRDESYWSAREDGAKAAYATMAGVADAWTDTTPTVNGHTVHLSTLTAAPDVSLVFLRLPEGQGVAGDGGSTYDYESIKKLWLGTLSPITSVDGTATYTKQGLIDTLTALMDAAAPSTIATHDYAGSIGDSDNVDHYVTGYLTKAAQESYSTAHDLLSYQGYASQTLPANVAGADLTAKTTAFYAYGAYDELTCHDDITCLPRAESKWLARQYLVASAAVPPSGATSENVAASATVTASSQDSAAGQGADKAVDGVVAGYPAAPAYEWATVGGKVGSWLQLDWSSPQTLSQVVLYDRPNLADQATGGLLEFSDGSELAVGPLPNDGSALTISFIPRSVTNVRFSVASVLAGTANVGLAEIEAWAESSDPVVPATADAGPDQSVASEASVTLDGTGSSPGTGGALTYAWTQTGGPSVTLSAASAVSPTFTAPVGPATLTFSLAVSASTGSSSDDITIEVAAPPPAAPTASAGVDQTVASGAGVTLDGSGTVAGYPTTTTYAWSQTAGPTVTLSDDSAVSPTFTAPTGPTTLTFTLTASNTTGSTTDDVTVAVTPPPVAPSASAGVDQTVASGAGVTLDGSGTVAGYPTTTTYAWSQTAGPTVTLSDDSAVSPTFTAPTGPTVLTFTLTASNTTGSTTDDVTVTVTAPAASPTASAGADQSVASGASVTLSGSGSSPGTGGALTYAWAQTGGPSVALSSASAVSPTFAAPNGPATLTFRLTVSNSTGSDTDDVTVTVAPITFPSGTTRLAGATRYETAIQVSKRYAPGVPAVYVATGTNFPDALSAAAAAAHVGGPLLLTAPTSLPSAVKAEIQRLDPAKIYVIGGTGAVSTSVAQALATIAPVTRLGGADRYATGLKIVNTTFASSTTAFLATGRSFPDALAASGAAGKLGAPVILIDGTKSTVDSATLAALSRLGVTKIRLAGGTGVIPSSIATQLKNAGYSVSRYGGADRYATAALINNAFFSGGSTTMFLATGLNFPDALAGAALAGHLSAPLYVTTTTCAPPTIHDSVQALGASSTVVLGGTAVVSSAAAANHECS